MLPITTILHTDGSGYWSRHAGTVSVTGLLLTYENHDFSFGELRVYFDTSVWDRLKHGLVYTDKLFIKELHEWLFSLGFGIDVSYSEQGMQGDNYVSLDVGPNFIESYKNYWKRQTVPVLGY